MLGIAHRALWPFVLLQGRPRQVIYMSHEITRQLQFPAYLPSLQEVDSLCDFEPPLQISQQVYRGTYLRKPGELGRFEQSAPCLVSHSLYE